MNTTEITYRRLAPVYDVVYGVGLHQGRMFALERMALQPGESVLEIGVGTGLSAVHYPSTSRVTAVDISSPMLMRAQARLRQRQISHVSLCRMDAARLAFPDGRFDVVYAPYLINAGPDTERVEQEMSRVCKRGRRLVFVNHFDHSSRKRAVDRVIGRLAYVLSGVSWTLNLETFLSQNGLTATSVDHVNVGSVSSV